MRIAVAGGTGRIGRLTIAALDRAGHQTVPLSRGAGVDAYTGAGLADALRGADAVIDVTNTPSGDEAEIVDFFGTATQNLLAAGEQAGVRHHVLLSIVGIDHKQRVPHYAGKREQERLVASGPVPWSIVRATQFHDFAAMVAGWAEQDGDRDHRAAARAADRARRRGGRARRRRDRARRWAPGSTSPGRRRRTSWTWPGAPSPPGDRTSGSSRPGAASSAPTWPARSCCPARTPGLAPTTFDDWLAAGAR